MTTITGVIAAAALFALFGLLRPKRGCGSNCSACDAACHLEESSDVEA